MRKSWTNTLVAAGTVALLATPLTAQAASTSLDPVVAAGLSDALQTEAYDDAAHTLRAEQATREGRATAANTFAAAATQDREDHLRRLADAYGLVGTDAQNLQAAIDGETYEATVMYPEFAATAQAEGCDAAYSLFKSIGAEEWMHARKYRAALSAVTRGTGSVPQPSSLQGITVTPSRTNANLVTAMHGEALAKQKYAAFAAATEDRRVARLFSVTGDVEFRQHFSDQAQLSGLLGDTDTNLNRAAANEEWQATVYYPGLAQDATVDPQVAGIYRDLAEDEAAQALTFRAVR